MAGRVFFRLRCGDRVWSSWLAEERDAWDVAVAEGLATRDARRTYPAPLVWIEKGHRKYAKSRTVPMTAELDGQPLKAGYRNPLS